MLRDSEPAAVDALAAAARRFGGDAAADKKRLLSELESRRLSSASTLLELQPTLLFLRAFPDDAEVRARADALADGLPERFAACRSPERLVNEGFPGSENVYPYSFGVARRLARHHPGALGIDWRADAVGPVLESLLALAALRGEGAGLEDQRVTLRDWLRAARPPGASDAETLLGMVDGMALPLAARGALYDGASLTLRYRLAQLGQSRCGAVRAVERPFYHPGPLDHGRFPLEPRITDPLPPSRKLGAQEGARWIGFALDAMCARNLEIYPLTWANPDDVEIVNCARGVEVLLCGVLPEMRDALEVIGYFLVLKNGVPIGYGPSALLVGAVEVGINLFPEFRGAEVRHLYAELMRVLHQRLGARYFFLTTYAMGTGNPEALRSGAFWFYRKLGFRPTRPEVEAIALREEEVLLRDPRHRSSPETLRQLSRTEAVLDLSGGALRPADPARLSLALTERVAREHGGDRRRAERTAEREVARALRLDVGRLGGEERRALRGLAPLLAMTTELARWNGHERRSLARIVRAKGAPREAEAARLMAGHARLMAELHRFAPRGVS